MNEHTFCNDFRQPDKRTLREPLSSVTNRKRYMTYAAINFRQKFGLLIEPKGVFNTGDERGERTAENDVWI